MCLDKSHTYEKIVAEMYAHGICIGFHSCAHVFSEYPEQRILFDIDPTSDYVSHLGQVVCMYVSVCMLFMIPRRYVHIRSYY